MAKRSTISILAQERGVSEESLVRDLLAEHESAEKAAKAIKAGHNLIHVWAKKHGYRIARDCKSSLVRI